MNEIDIAIHVACNFLVENRKKWLGNFEQRFGNLHPKHQEEILSVCGGELKFAKEIMLGLAKGKYADREIMRILAWPIVKASVASSERKDNPLKVNLLQELGNVRNHFKNLEVEITQEEAIVFSKAVYTDVINDLHSEYKLG